MNLENVLKTLFPIVDAAPTYTPALPIAFALYKNGSTKRLYIYYDGAWQYATLS